MRDSNQLSYEATKFGSWSFVGPKEPVRNECKVITIWNISHIELRMWNQVAMILAVMKAMYAIVYIEAWKSQDFNGVWTHDFSVLVLRSNQLSYEATDIGSWSYVGPEEPVRKESEVLYQIFHIMSCRCEIM